MARVLSIDYGQKRSGLAVTDTLQLIAGGLATVSTKELMSFLQDYLQRESVERIVVGLPKQTNGMDSENLGRVKGFVQRLQHQWPDLPVEWYDERFTSVLAHRAMLEGGLKKKSRQDKALVDEISATIILQDWLEARR